MSETGALIVKAQRYLRSAELLFRDGDYASSVSRSYYAMFYSAEATLLTKELTFSSHRAVIAAFGEHFVKTGVFPREFGRELNKAFEQRQLGDYESASTIPEETARETLTRAKEFCDEIARWFGESQG
jgi:uncharacterized protein (UPF0332 family)